MCKINLIVLFVFCALANKLTAAVYAGNVTFTWLYGYTYKITATTYTTRVPDNACSLVLSNGGGTISVPRSNGPFSANCSPATGGVPFNASILKNEYIYTHTFPGLGNYSVDATLPNRAPGIINVSNSVNTPLVIQSSLVISSFLGPNSQPILPVELINTACTNNGCYQINFAGSDIDGDSLAYSVLPCSGPGATLPPSTFTINAVTGTLTWCTPSVNGAYNFLLKVEESRTNGNNQPVMISFFKSELQLIRETCTGSSDANLTENVFTVFPNPTKNSLTVSVKPNEQLFSIQLLDLNGCTVLEYAVDSYQKPHETISMDLENVNPGMYFLKVNCQNSTTIQKIIKQ